MEHILSRITHSVFRTQVAENVNYVHVHYALEPIKRMIFDVSPVRLLIKEILVEHINSDASKGTIKI